MDVSQRVLKQRISDVEHEFEQKYNEAKDQLKCDRRLTVDAIMQLDVKSQ